MSLGMVALLAGMGGGYLRGKQQSLEEARQAKLDAQATELHTARMADIAANQSARQEDLDYKSAQKAALSAGQITPVTQGVGDAGSSFDVKDPAAAAMMTDMAATKGETVTTNDASRVSTGALGATQNGTVAGKQVIADPAQAQAVAKKMNMSEYQKLKARQDVAEQFGKMEVSDDIRAKLYKLESEGAFRALALAKNGDFVGAAKHYQETGGDRMPEGSRFDAVESVDPITKAKTQTIRLVGKDGAPIIPDVDMALRSYLSPSEQYTMNRGDKQDAREANKDKQTQDNWQQTFDFNKKKEENDTQYKNRLLGLQANQDARAAEMHKITMADAKVPAAVKLQAATLAEEMKSVSAAMNKAMAENSFDPKSANAKSLIERQAALGIQYRNLMQPHMPGAKDKPAADPLGLVTPAPGQAPAAAQPGNAAPAAATNVKPAVSMQQVAAPVAPKAPLRSVDGGKTWTLDVPKTIPDPSVKWYREIPNPAFQAVGDKTFASADEARAAFSAFQ